MQFQRNGVMVEKTQLQAGGAWQQEQDAGGPRLAQAHGNNKLGQEAG